VAEWSPFDEDDAVTDEFLADVKRRCEKDPLRIPRRTANVALARARAAKMSAITRDGGSTVTVIMDPFARRTVSSEEIDRDKERSIQGKARKT
jgi:hypothetical protein